MPWSGAIINFELIHKSQTSQQRSDPTSKKGQNKGDCISNLDKNPKWNGMDYSVNLSCSRLERYIAKIASVDRWLPTIGNNRIQWSMNLKNIAKTMALMLKQKNRIFHDGKTRRPWKTMENKTIGDEGITVDFLIIKVHTSNWSSNSWGSSNSWDHRIVEDHNVPLDH